MIGGGEKTADTAVTTFSDGVIYPTRKNLLVTSSKAEIQSIMGEDAAKDTGIASQLRRHFAGLTALTAYRSAFTEMVNQDDWTILDTFFEHSITQMSLQVHPKTKDSHLRSQYLATSQHVSQGDLYGLYHQLKWDGNSLADGKAALDRRRLSERNSECEGTYEGIKSRLVRGLAENADGSAPNCSLHTRNACK
ncbi:hypothetical protein CCR75_005511 [Bremia lactucae]|uniref:Uncharacterized protein n=1 Tax=Bremia lactucae TaxID=4779 RepID=A0A976IKC7_BRELC|nr:hypothetical protein CCR75_005511 [Bremia lactucae]